MDIRNESSLRDVIVIGGGDAAIGCAWRLGREGVNYMAVGLPGSPVRSERPDGLKMIEAKVVKLAVDDSGIYTAILETGMKMYSRRITLADIGASKLFKEFAQMDDDGLVLVDGHRVYGISNWFDSNLYACGKCRRQLDGEMVSDFDDGISCAKEIIEDLARERHRREMASVLGDVLR